MKKGLLCAVFFLVAAAFACLGMFHLERAASCLPEGIIICRPKWSGAAADGRRCVGFPLDRQLCERGRMGHFPAVLLPGDHCRRSGAACDFTSWAWRWRTSPFHQRYCHYAPPAENCLLAGVDSLFTGHCLLRYGEDLSPPVEDLHRNQESCRSLIPVRCVSGIVRGVCYRLAVTANTRYLPANRAFL